MFFTTKLASGAVAAVLSIAVTGAAALAAFPPAAATAVVGATESGGAAGLHAERDRPKAGIEQILERLVQNGTITQAQKEAILKAFKEAAGERKDRDKDREGAAVLKRVMGDLMQLSAEYLGLRKEDLGAQLKAGKSLGEIANATAGKTRDGLIGFLVVQVSTKLDQAVADGKITREQAEQVKSHLTERMTKFVDHKIEARRDKDRDRGKHIQPEAFMGDLLKAATAYLGIERGAIQSQLAQGKSLGEITNATAGKSRDGLIQALVAAATTEIDAAVAKGRVTAEQAAKMKDQLAASVAKRVDAKRVKPASSGRG